MAKARKMFRHDRAAGLLMIAAMLLALATANSPLAELYRQVHHASIHFRFAGLVIDEPLVNMINEGLMVFFFLLVGLEIKRQFIEGHLSSVKHAILPMIAAIGGMLGPASIYLLLNFRDDLALAGWAIPMATDIVLAIGILSVLGNRVPVGVKVFLTALAIFDDIGAVLIVSLFYGDMVLPLDLIPGGLALFALVMLRRAHVRSQLACWVLGIILWLSMLEAGLQAALAGFLVAMTIPHRSRKCPKYSPLRNAEQNLHPWCALVIIPVFAFFNAGVDIDIALPERVFDPIFLGIFLGLFLGKQLGVVGACLVAVHGGFGCLPNDVTWKQIHGAAILAGVGFTMSLFMTPLAFADADMIASSKFAILAASLTSGVVGLVVIARAAEKPMKVPGRQSTLG